MILSKQIFLSRTYQNEDVFTADTNMYISHNYPSLRGLYFHVPNEVSQKTTPAIIMKRQAMGVLSGVFDFCFLPVNGFSLWFLELKIKGGKLSKHQSLFLCRCTDQGIICATAYEPKDVCNHVETIYGKPMYEK